MNILLIAAHGSRRKESCIEVKELAKSLSDKLKHEFDSVEHAFLQFAQPLLEQKMEDLVSVGAEKITIFPFFISSGSHILEDIPQIVEAAQKKHTHVRFSLTRHLGKIEAIEDVIVNEVNLKQGIKHSHQ